MNDDDWWFLQGGLGRGDGVEGEEDDDDDGWDDGGEGLSSLSYGSGEAWPYDSSETWGYDSSEAWRYDSGSDCWV